MNEEAEAMEAEWDATAPAMSYRDCRDLWWDLLYRGALRQPGQRIGVVLRPHEWPAMNAFLDRYYVKGGCEGARREFRIEIDPS